MAAPPSHQAMSVAEYLTLEEGSLEKHEYVDGRLYAMAGGTYAHDRIGNNVRALINAHLGDGPCVLNGPDVRLRITPTLYYYPDAFVTCDQDIDAGSTELSGAHLILEILSTSTEAADRGEKFGNYQTLATCTEYVLIDSRRRMVEHFRRADGANWLYHRYVDGETVTLVSIDLTMPVSTLYLATGV